MTIIAKPLTHFVQKNQSFLFGSNKKKGFQWVQKMSNWKSDVGYLFINGRYWGEDKNCTKKQIVQLSNKQFKGRPTNSVSRWILYHRRVSKMKHVDALSIYPPAPVNQISVELTSRMKNSQYSVPQLKTIMKFLKFMFYELVKEDLFKNIKGMDLIVMQIEIIRKAH